LINDTIELHCETVIISTGASAKYLGLPSEQHYLKWEVEFQLQWFVMDFHRNQEVVDCRAEILHEEGIIFLNFVKK
jgi:thioredoxin reductase (NADPH)